MKYKIYYIYNKEDLLGLLIREQDNYKFFRNDKVDVNLVPKELISKEAIINANQFVDSRRIARVDNSGVIEDLIEDTSLVNMDDHIWVKTDSMKSFSQHPRCKESKSVAINLDSIEDEYRLCSMYSVYKTEKEIGLELDKFIKKDYKLSKPIDIVIPTLGELNRDLAPFNKINKELLDSITASSRALSETLLELNKSFNSYKLALSESLSQLNKSYTFSFSETIWDKCLELVLEKEGREKPETDILLSELLEEYDKEV